MGSSFLCLRRGVSKTKYYDAYQIIFSLPTQRCFRLFRNHVVIEILFSAYAEVFPLSASVLRSERPFLCLRRGVSGNSQDVERFHDFSLPTQRCFRVAHRLAACLILFSAYAEVFLLQIMHLMQSTGFSLPTQRCFSGSGHRVRGRSSFLCLRRGVSTLQGDYVLKDNFSLPTQRCFRLQADPHL